MLAPHDLLATGARTPTPDDVGRALWLFGVLLGVGLGLLVAVVVAVRYLRRSNAPPKPRKGEPTPDPWLESGRRVSEADDHG